MQTQFDVGSFALALIYVIMYKIVLGNYTKVIKKKRDK